MNCIHYKVREDKRILSHAAYVVLGITIEDNKEILSFIVETNGIRRIWLGRLNGLHKGSKGCSVLLCGRSARVQGEHTGSILQSRDTEVRHPHAPQFIQICRLQRPEKVCL